MSVTDRTRTATATVRIKDARIHLCVHLKILFEIEENDQQEVCVRLFTFMFPFELICYSNLKTDYFSAKFVNYISSKTYDNFF